jgi:hypothetical protein
MGAFEIWTDGEGRVLEPVEAAIERTVVAAVANGDVHPDRADLARAELRGYAARTTRYGTSPMAQPEQPTSGRLQLLPVHLSEEITAAAISAAILPWGPPRFMALTGTATADNAEIAAITGEWPATAPSPVRDIEKQELERLHIDQFCTDHLLATGVLPYVKIGAVSAGQDPPDFNVVRADGSSAGVECTQFAIEAQRHAHALFDGIRRAVLAADRARFTHLAGATVFMWFRADDGRPSLPPRASDQEAANAVVEGLAEYKFDPDATKVPGGDLPQQAPDIGITNTKFGCGFYAVPMVGAAPATSFFAATGFELALSFQLTYRQEEIRTALVDAVAAKDRPESDELLITVGGPDSHGLTFTSEFFLLDFMLRAGDPMIPPPNHLSRVLVHVWGTGMVVQLCPSFVVVSTGPYAGLTPSHFPSAAPLGGEQATETGNEGTT